MSACVGVPADEENTNKEWTDRERMEHFIMEEAGLEPDTETVTSVLDTLWDNKITKAWQLAKLPDTILEKLFPVNEALQEYLLVSSVREILHKLPEPATAFCACCQLQRRCIFYGGTGDKRIHD